MRKKIKFYEKLTEMVENLTLKLKILKLKPS